MSFLKIATIEGRKNRTLIIEKHRKGSEVVETLEIFPYMHKMGRLVCYDCKRKRSKVIVLEEIKEMYPSGNEINLTPYGCLL